jgi:hypothetical protein
LLVAGFCPGFTAPIASAQGEEEAEMAPGPPPGSEDPSEGLLPPPAIPPTIAAPVLTGEPQGGKGRMEVAFSGNRRWCTFPDDRVVRPPERPGTRGARQTEVFTFGYKLTLAAIKRGAADTSLMLYESPTFRTASWRPAFKLGLDRRTPHVGPKIMGNEGPSRPSSAKAGPGALVPYWQDRDRCVTLPARMDFDLEPGTYDVYIAFDVMMRDGSWVHRTSGYLTEIPVRAERRTRVDGIVNLTSADRRDVDLLTSSLLPEGSAAEAGDP